MATKSRKSSSNIHRRTSHGSVISLKKDRSSITSRERRSTAQSIEETFEMLFKKFCTQFNSWIIPEVIVVPFEPPPGDFPELPFEDSKGEIHVNIKKEEPEKTFKNLTAPIPALLAIFDNYEILTVLNSVILKHFKVDRSMLIALRKSFQKFDTIRALKLEFCQLKNIQLRTLKTILQRNELITDLSIDGNPNRFQNFYILLKNTKLLHVSMRFCQINDRGVHLIALQLRSAFDQPLTSLNLSSNFVSDEGSISIANVLRINRNLLSLNLADNWLTDTGCIMLMAVLKKFSLNHEEIVLRRHRIMRFLLTKAQMIEDRKFQLLHGSDTQSMQSLQSYSKRLSKDSVNKAGKDNSSTRRSSKGVSSTGSTHKKDKTSGQIKKSIDLDMQLIEEMVESEMGSDQHPFVKDAFPEDKEIYCKGNFKLINLNLAYNKITVRGLQEILETLRYQQTMVINLQEGLWHITLEGNSVSECCDEIGYINELMQESYSRRFSNASNDSRQSSKRKRSGLGRVSITL